MLPAKFFQREINETGFRMSSMPPKAGGWRRVPKETILPRLLHGSARGVKGRVRGTVLSTDDLTSCKRRGRRPGHTHPPTPSPTPPLLTHPWTRGPDVCVWEAPPLKSENHCPQVSLSVKRNYSSLPYPHPGPSDGKAPRSSQVGMCFGK